MSYYSVYLLVFTIIPSFLTHVDAHGMMCTPRQRAAYISSKCGSDLDVVQSPVIDYCAHCLNGGTVAVTSSNLPPQGFRVYDPIGDFDLSATRAGLCGDPKGQNHHMLGGDFMPSSYGTVPMVAHYKTGAHVDFVAEIDTNHNGYFEFFLCDLDACKSSDIADKCFKNGHCYRLDRVPHPDCQDPTRNTHYECGPIDIKYPSRWYLPCRNTGHVGIHIVGGPSGTMRFQLPAGVSCKHCVIQWYWATANSCAPRGLLDYMARENNPFGTTCESDGGGVGTYRPGMSECTGTAIPEEFWSCADVQITEHGQAAGPVQLVAGNFTDPPSKDGFVDDAKVNPEEAADKIRDEAEQDLNMTANEESGKRKREERAAADGKCLLEGEVCDGSVYCCDHSDVCVFKSNESSFRCTKWWSLWEEKEWRDNLSNEKNGNETNSPSSTSRFIPSFSSRALSLSSGSPST